MKPEEIYDRGFRDGLAAARRRELRARPVLCVGPVTLDRDERAVLVSGHKVGVTPRQAEILALLLQRKHHRVSIGELGASGAVMVSQLRKRLSAVGAPADFIVSAPWHGYRINPAYSPG